MLLPVPPSGATLDVRPRYALFSGAALPPRRRSIGHSSLIAACRLALGPLARSNYAITSRPTPFCFEPRPMGLVSYGRVNGGIRLLSQWRTVILCLRV